jgi:hypothetical protein
MHGIELAVRNGAASWCSCTCGWASTEMSEDDAANAWASHLAETMLTQTSTPNQSMS